jgi:hypothetical protein
MVILLGAACKAAAPLPESSLRATDDVEARSVDASTSFRSLMHKLLPGGTWARKHFDYLVYLPSDDPAESNAATGEERLGDMSSYYKNVRPSDLFFKGQKAELALAPDNIDHTLRQHPVTIVIVPGVFGEFIKTRPMEEVVSRTNSSFAREVRAKLSEGVTDQHFDLKAYGQVEKPLSELFLAASVDDAQGEPLYRVIEFVMPFMALESLGKNADVSQIYLRRLDKLFAAIGTPDNIVFMGYSRGTPLGLQMLADAKNGADPVRAAWLNNTRGLISLGGVIYGSDLADDGAVAGSKLNKQLSALRKLLDALEEIPGGSSPLKRAKIVKSNTVAWGKFAAAMIQADPSFDPRTIKTISGGDPRAPARLMIGLWGSLGLNDFLTGYSANIRKFKYFGEQVLAAIEELTTPVQLAWWRSHVVPTSGLRYYAINATMADPEREEMGAEHAGNRIAYHPDSIDYKMLLTNHRDFARASGQWLNDSQVAMHKARFWPGLAPRLNPRQPELAQTYLGVLGTHHWGLALATVNEMADRSVDPFPREALLKALAAQVALDLSER